MTVRSKPGFAPPPKVAAAPDPGGPRGDGGTPAGQDRGSTLALSALTVVSALAFSRVFTTSGWITPVVVTALGAHGLAWYLRQRGVPLGSSLVAAVIAVGLAGCYLVLPADLTWGLPLGHMYHTLGDALHQAGNGMRSDITPVPSEPGYSLLLVWGTGAAAVLADLMAFRLEAPLQALAAPFALFLTASAIGTSRGRAWTVGLEVAALALFLLVERLDADRRGSTWLGGRGGGAARAAITAGGITAAAAVIAAIALTPAIPNREGDGVLGWRSAPGSGNGARITPSPLDDLRTRLLDNPDTVVMTVTSSAPSYWRLTSLNDFDGTVWSSNDSYQTARGRLPGVQVTRGTQQVRETFHIAALDSIWLPTGFNPEAVRHTGDVSWDPVSGSLISPQATSDGESYTVDASEQLASLSATLLATTPPLATAAVPEADLTLPSNIPKKVLNLARSLTAGDQTEYAKAYALEQFFHQPPFTYTTTPASDDSLDALQTFLFQTHQGYCQQFAGAYAVLARAVGLPTRIAIGFQTGSGEGGVYTVTDADAHAWPEVWFPTVGWVPFEPTPGRQLPSASYTGTTNTVQNPSAASTPSTTGAASSAPNPSDRTKTQAPTGTVVPTSTMPHHGGSHRLAVIAIALGILATLAAGWSAVVVSLRRLRWRRRRNGAGRGATGGPPRPRRLGGPDQSWVLDPTARRRVLVAWAETAEVLAWWQLRRRRHETVMEFVGRAAPNLGGMGLGQAALEQLRELGGLVQLAEFSGAELPGVAAQRAEDLSRILIARLRRAAPRARRIEELIDPRRALRRVTVEAPPPVEAGRPPR